MEIESKLNGDERLRGLGAQLAVVGAFTVNWDTLLSVELAGRTIKLSTVLFLFSILLSSPSSVLREVRPRPDSYERRIHALLGILLGWLLLRTFFVSDLSSALRGFLAVLIPAGAPLIAILLHRRWARSLLKSFALGMVISSVAAILEFAFRTTGHRWITNYSAFTNGRFRSAGFAFEAAFFAAPAFAALMVLWLSQADNMRHRRLFIALLLVGLVLANARIIFVQLGVAAICISTAQRHLSFLIRRETQRRVVRTSVCLCLAFAVTSLVSPSIFTSTLHRFLSIFDPTEQSSNAVRLSDYSWQDKIIGQNVLFGIGPGRLGHELISRGYPVPESGSGDAVFVANNVWRQALLDGGTISVVLQGAIVASVLRLVRQDLRRVELAVWIGWASLVLGAGLTVSNFWDAEPWLLLGCLLGIRSGDRDNEGDCKSWQAADARG
jgi:hypothetical protein